MTDYISREAALLSMTPIVKRASERNRNILSAVKQCVDAINWCPAADVVPVVRCKDCKHSAIDYIGLLYCKGVTYYNHVPEDWYCADGERKDMVTDCNQVKDGDGDV